MPKSSSKAKTPPKRRASRAASKDSSPGVSRTPKAQGLVRKDAALRRLKITRTELERAPEITSILKSSFRTVKAAIQAMRHSNDEAAIAFLACYDGLPVGDVDYLPLEAICLKAEVSPAALLGATFLACKTIRGQESALIAVNAHPGVLKKTIEYASLPGGDRDRKLLHEAVGFLPTPKGVSMNVNLLNGQPQFKGPAKDEEPDEEDFAELFPSIGGKLEEWSDDRRKLLSDGG